MLLYNATRDPKRHWFSSQKPIERKVILITSQSLCLWHASTYLFIYLFNTLLHLHTKKIKKTCKTQGVANKMWCKSGLTT